MAQPIGGIANLPYNDCQQRPCLDQRCAPSVWTPELFMTELIALERTTEQTTGSLFTSKLLDDATQAERDTRELQEI